MECVWNDPRVVVAMVVVVKSVSAEPPHQIGSIVEGQH